MDVVDDENKLSIVCLFSLKALLTFGSSGKRGAFLKCLTICGSQQQKIYKINNKNN